MPASLSDRLRSTDLIERTSAQSEVVRQVLDRLPAPSPAEPRTRLLDVLADNSNRTTCDLARALLDVTSADLAGLSAPGVVPLPAPPLRPLLNLARPFGDMLGAMTGDGRLAYVVPIVSGLPTPNVDAPEKSDAPATGKLTISEDTVPGHQVDTRVDISVAAALRSSQPDAIEQQLLAAVAAAAEAAVAADLAAAATGTATTLLDAVATALQFGPPVVVIADAASWAGAAQTLAPLLTASPGAVVLVPVGGATVGTVVVPQGDLLLFMSPVFRQRVPDPVRLGYDLSLSLHLLAAIGHPAYSTAIAATP